MPFCEKCGNELKGNEKFCSNCGNEIILIDNSKRKMVYEGEIRKCPNCGEILKSFSTNCPVCGFELRNVQTSSAIKELVVKLQEIESKAMPNNNKNKSVMKTLFGKDFKNEDEENRAIYEFKEQKAKEKANLIINFAVPNTKEDILEFMLLASSNLNNKAMPNDIIIEDIVLKAWKSKLEQIYKKAELSMKDSSNFDEIKEIYNTYKKQEKLEKMKYIYGTSSYIILVISLLGLLWNPVLTIEFIIGLVILIITSFILVKKKTKISKSLLTIVIVIIVYVLMCCIFGLLTNSSNENSNKNSTSNLIESNKDSTIKDFSNVDTMPNIDVNTEETSVKTSTNSKIESNKDNKKKSESITLSADNVIINNNNYFEIQEVGYKIASGYLKCTVVISNVNSEKAIEFAKYRVTAYDNTGKVLGSDDQTIGILYPNQRIANAGVEIKLSEQPSKIEFTAVEPADYNIRDVSTLKYSNYKDLKSQNISVVGNRITGEIQNENDFVIGFAKFTIVFRDNNNKIIDSKMDFLFDIPSKGKAPFDVTLSSDVEVSENIEVIAYKD